MSWNLSITLLLAALLVPQDADRLRAVRDYAAGESASRPDLAGLDWKAVKEALAGWKYGPAESAGTETSRTHKLANGRNSTFYYYVPKSYDPAKPAPLVFFLHGGVSAPRDGMGKGGWEVWKAEADANGWIACSPSGWNQCLWWTPTGEEHVLEAIRTISARLHVDRNRVWVSGFSDGASGVYSLGMKRTDVWAACVPWNGAVAVVTAPQAGCTPFYTVNCRGTAWRPTHGGKDQLYPAQTQAPVIDQMKAAGVPVEWKNFEDAGHDGGRIIGGDREFIDAWLPKQVRNPLPAEVDWTTHDAEHHGEAWWVRVLELGDRPGDPFAGEKDFTFPLGQAGPPRPMLGIQIDQNFEGPGVRIQAVTEGSGAEEAGLDADDVIDAISGKEVNSFDDLRAVLGQAKSGDKLKVKIHRGEEAMDFEVPFRPIEIKGVVIPAAGRIRATRDGNTVKILTKRVARFELLISPDAFDLGKEIVVTLNGKEVHRGLVPSDPGVLIDEMRRRHGDTGVFYAARLAFAVTKE